MRLPSLLLAAVLARLTVAELTFSATAVQGGKKIDTSGLQFVPIPPRSSFHFRHGDRNATAAFPGGHKNHRAGEKAKRTSVGFSSDWCGVSQHASSTDPLTSVSGIFSAPSLTERPGLSYPQYGAAWVGIDGASCQSALLQAGITTVLNSNGQQSASAWWEWVPNSSYSISGFPVKAGEWISVTVSASSATKGQMSVLVPTSLNSSLSFNQQFLTQRHSTIANLDQDYTLTIVLNDGPALCRADADWIVEDFFDSKGNSVSFGRFDDIWFEECSATTAGGNTIGLDGASMIYMGTTVANSKCLAQPYDDSNFYCTSQG